VFEYYSSENGTPVLLFRLNYAVDLRYGVMVDIARKVFEGDPSSFTSGISIRSGRGCERVRLRCLEICQSPPRALNITGPDIISVRGIAEFFAERFGKQVDFEGEESGSALLSNASAATLASGRHQ